MVGLERGVLFQIKRHFAFVIGKDLQVPDAIAVFVPTARDVGDLGQGRERFLELLGAGNAADMPHFQLDRPFAAAGNDDQGIYQTRRDVRRQRRQNRRARGPISYRFAGVFGG